MTLHPNPPQLLALASCLHFFTSKLGTSQPQTTATSKRIPPYKDVCLPYKDGLSLPELQSPEDACHVAVSLHQGNSQRGGVTAVLLLTVTVSRNRQTLAGHLPTEAWAPGTGLEIFHLYCGKKASYTLPML